MQCAINNIILIIIQVFINVTCHVRSKITDEKNDVGSFVANKEVIIQVILLNIKKIIICILIAYSLWESIS